MDLAAYYAESRRRRAIATAEYAARSHGWQFGLAPAAAGWAGSQSIGHRDLARLVQRADQAGLLLKPEPGVIQVAFANRDESERESGIGFGFWPESAEYLVLHGSAAIMFADLPGLTAYQVLDRVVATLAAPRPTCDPVPRDWAG